MRFFIFAALSVMVESQAFAQNSTVIIQSGAPPYPLVTGVGGLSPDVEAAIRLSQGGVGRPNGVWIRSQSRAARFWSAAARQCATTGAGWPFQGDPSRSSPA